MNPAATETESAIAAKATADASPRRSGRSRVSTTMKIQGHTVLRKNNYQVNGTTYVFDVHDEDTPGEAATAPPRPKKPRTTGKVRKESLAEAKRRKHNQLVEESAERKSGLRKSFLANRLDVLLPFLEPKVANRLRAFREAKASKHYTERTATVVTQPRMIKTAILRPYQLRGLEFMVAMHEQNLAMILGDEMGLVRIQHAVGHEF